MVAAQTPTIAKIKNEVSEGDIRALLTIAVAEVCNFFNVGKNMNDAQIALTVDLIIERFWYFKLEEIKYCFRRAMMHEKLFDRLDGNIILGWLQAYDAERTEEAMRLSDQEATERMNRQVDNPDGISFAEYVAKLEQRSATDESAAKRLADIQAIMQTPNATSKEEQQQKEHDFKLWKNFKYLLGKKDE